MSGITPYLMYEDAAAAMDFLSRAFGFKEVSRSHAPDDGRVRRAEMELEGARIYLGQPGGDFRSPRHGSGATVAVHVYVEDVDAHFKRAVAAGTEIGAALEDRDYGDRRYHAVDPEGHVWIFATHVADGSPEWQATLAGQPSTE
jgi:PhnB protein